MIAPGARAAELVPDDAADDRTQHRAGSDAARLACLTRSLASAAFLVRLHLLHAAFASRLGDTVENRGGGDDARDIAVGLLRPRAAAGESGCDGSEENGFFHASFLL